MLEHVGPEHYRELGRVMDRSLGAGGRAFVHTIGRSRPLALNPWIERRIFPGARPPTLGEMMELFEPFGFAVLDVENLRLHYAETLRHWLSRYEGSIERVREMFDEHFVRAWRLYLSGSIAAFTSGTLELFQVLVNRATSAWAPMSRSHLYQNEPSPPWNAATR
jgi:cyclopropane-fatty-acyl-phospholipid synthase